MRLYKRLFFLLVLLIPVNLGKHFIIRESYVYGLLVDYLIPTVFVQDLLVLLLLFVWIVTIIVKKEVILKVVNPLRHHRFFQFLVLFLVALLFSVINSGGLLISWIYFIRTLFYASLSLFIYSEITSGDDILIIKKVLSISVIFVSLLGIAQFVMRGSVFDNYLVFGEQPYDIKTRNLNFEYLLGKKVIPSYGLFRHPNVFGGYLSLLLTMFFVNLGFKQNIFESKKFKTISINIPKITSQNLFTFMALFLGTLTLLLTFSYITLSVYLLGI